MPQRQAHRGKHPEDGRLFSADRIPDLRRATADLSILLDRGYSETASLKLVGDRYQLDARQRRAVVRAACPDQTIRERQARNVSFSDLQNNVVDIDGYNLLITAESILSGGVVLRCRDTCIRDIASLHGSYHYVEETLAAIQLIGKVLQEARPARVLWHFDAPVSNSERLKQLVERISNDRALPWEAVVEANPDVPLALSQGIVVTSDRWILDRAARWTNLAQELLMRCPEACCTLIDLS